MISECPTQGKNPIRDSQTWIIESAEEFLAQGTIEQNLVDYVRAIQRYSLALFVTFVFLTVCF